MAHAGSHTAGDGHHQGVHSPKFYVKIWAWLLLLLVLSVLGPELGVRWITILTAFGIAIVKAYMVAVNFMHLNVEKRFVTWVLLSMIIVVGLFFVAVAPDVMKPSGNNWINQSATDLIDFHKKNPGAGQPSHHP